MSVIIAPLPKQDATGNPPLAMLPLFTELNAHRGPLTIEVLDAALRRLKVDRAALASAIKIDAGGYVRTLVAHNDRYDAFVMAWLPGQRSPIHDHKGSACAVRVVSGRGVEQRFVLDEGTGDLSATTRHYYEPGLVACSVDEDIHAFGNAVPAPASPDDILVTIHVYAPPLAPTRKYTLSTSDESWSI